MSKKNKPTAAEWTILEVLWNESPLSVREVFERIGEAKMNAQTVRTLTDRLLAKGLVQREDVHGVWVFRANCPREDAMKVEGRGFLERFFGGSPALGAAYFIQQEKMPAAEIRRLKKMLDGILEDDKK